MIRLDSMYLHASLRPRENRIYMKRIFLLLMLLQLWGCAAMNVLQFEDAETEPPGSARCGGFIGVGPNFYNPYRDSSRAPGAISFMTGVSGKLGLLDWIDFGGGGWTNSIPPMG